MGTVRSLRSLTLMGMCAATIGLCAVAEAPTAGADVCGSVGGRRVSVSACGNVADAIAPWAPGPAYYAPMPEDFDTPPPPPPPPPPPNVSVCGSFGRRVSVSGCT